MFVLFHDVCYNLVRKDVSVQFNSFKRSRTMLMHMKKYTEYLSNIWYLHREILDFKGKKSIFFINKDVSRVVKLVLIKNLRSTNIFWTLSDCAIKTTYYFSVHCFSCCFMKTLTVFVVTCAGSRKNNGFNS